MSLRKNKGGLTSAHLHLIGMFLMLCDHIWATSILPYEFLTVIGRITFPIFAFLTVEGFYHTHDVKKYLKRLFMFALISEIPFDLVVGGSWFYPFHQNVIWTFFIGVFMLHLARKQKKRDIFLKAILSGLICVCALAIASITMVDYYAYGILTILVFYVFRGRKWYHYLGQFMGIYYINWELLGGLVYPMSIGNSYFELPQQGFAILALIFIWLYNGEKGYNKKWFQTMCYCFYPAHLLILGVLQFIV